MLSVFRENPPRENSPIPLLLADTIPSPRHKGEFFHPLHLPFPGLRVSQK